MDFNLKNKVAIVTGGGSGLGASIVSELVKEGVNVVVNDINKEKEIKSFVKKLNNDFNSDSTVIFGDVSKTKDIEMIIENTLDKYGKIDILINNAGVWPKAYVKDMDDEEWKKTIEINLTGPFLFSKRVVRHWLNKERKGKIINITSQAAFNGSTSGHAHYAASKGGLVSFTVSLAREVAPFGINVTAVAPGMMRTAMNKDALKKREEEYLERIPLGRIADPQEIAYSVIFLASNKADYITGATIDVTGGMLMR